VFRCCVRGTFPWTDPAGLSRPGSDIRPQLPSSDPPTVPSQRTFASRFWAWNYQVNSVRDSRRVSNDSRHQPTTTGTQRQNLQTFLPLLRVLLGVTDSFSPGQTIGKFCNRTFSQRNYPPSFTRALAALSCQLGNRIFGHRSCFDGHLHGPGPLLGFTCGAKVEYAFFPSLSLRPFDYFCDGNLYNHPRKVGRFS